MIHPYVSTAKHYKKRENSSVIFYRLLFGAIFDIALSSNTINRRKNSRISPTGNSQSILKEVTNKVEDYADRQ